jgi:hypothetical protein
MVMQQSPTVGVDYEIEIFVPGNPDFNKYLSVCNQEMPSGGKVTPRKFGWL